MTGPSELHETIVNDIWEIFLNDVMSEYGSPFSNTGVAFGIDAVGAKYTVGVTGIGSLIADFYFDPNDGHGFVVGEVGEMKSDKWAKAYAGDGVPVRVLRVGFDRSIGMINPRFTEREIKIVKILQNGLWTIKFGEDL